MEQEHKRLDEKHEALISKLGSKSANEKLQKEEEVLVSQSIVIETNFSIRMRFYRWQIKVMRSKFFNQTQA
jgi:hypothetical protein